MVCSMATLFVWCRVSFDVGLRSPDCVSSPHIHQFCIFLISGSFESRHPLIDACALVCVRLCVCVRVCVCVCVYLCVCVCVYL